MTRTTHRHLRSAVITTVAASLVLAVAACGDDANAAAGGGDPKQVTIAYQPGLSYAPLLLLKQDRTLEKKFPDTTFKWKELSSSSAVQDGMISGDIQVGAGSAAQMILAWDKGVAWKYLSSLNDAQLWLMAKDPKLTSLKDFTHADQIAMPSPTSVQALVLRKAAQDQLGKASALDTNIVAMAHPDGVQNLISGQVAGHLTSPPFEFQEKEQGAHTVLKSTDVFGKTMFNGVFLMDDFYQQNTAFAEGLSDALEGAIDELKDDPAKAAKSLSENAGGKTSPAEFEKYLTNPAITFTTEPHGLEKIAAFMKDIKMISKTPESWKDLTFPTLQSAHGN